MNFSFELIETYLIKLLHLKYLTIDICELDLIDGKQWEKFLRKTQIIKFNFKFILSENVIFNQNESILLQSFQSSSISPTIPLNDDIGHEYDNGNDQERTDYIIDTFLKNFGNEMRENPKGWRGRFRKMAATPFNFYRGSAILFYRQATTMPRD